MKARVKQKFWGLVVSGLAVLLLETGLSDACDELPREPSPIWMAGNYEMAGHYFGKGMSGRNSGKFEIQLKTARDLAFDDLAKKIAVNVSSQMTDTMTSNRHGDRTTSAQTVQLTIETKVAQSLRDVQYNLWLDHDRCILWAYAYITNEAVEDVRREMLTKQKYEVMLGLLQRADRYRIREKKLASLKDAQRILGELDFKYLPGENGKEYYEELLSRRINDAVAVPE